MDEFDVEVFDPDSLSVPIGPLVSRYLERTAEYTPREFIRYMLYNISVVPTEGQDHATTAKFIPGCSLGRHVGPHPADVMVIGKIPHEKPPANLDDFKVQLVHPIDISLGSLKQLLIGVLEESGFSEEVYSKFYYTNVVRFNRLDGGVKKNIPVGWIRESAHLLEQEMRLVRPKWIVCMGTEASKALLKLPISKAIGVVHKYTSPSGHEANVVCVPDLRSILATFEARPSVVAAMKFFYDAYTGVDTDVRGNREYFYVDDLETLEAVTDQLIQDNITELSVDCEWGGGQHWLDTGAQLRTVQIAWSGSAAMVVILRRQGMRKAFHPDTGAAFRMLRKLLLRSGVRIIGHNLAADVSWLKDAGVDLSGGLYFDTMLASHLFEPTAEHTLESLAMRRLGWPKYDAPLEKWKDEHPIPEGRAYADIPDEMLHEYGADDVCATYLLYKEYAKLLLRKSNRGLHDLFYNLVMPADLCLIEMEMNGVLMDRDQLVSMEQRYQAAYEKLTEQFRDLISDPSFNPNSAPQKQKLLFDICGLTPVKTTGKYPKMWDEVMSAGEEGKYSPATDDETLGILAAESPIAAALQPICLIGTVLKSFLTAQNVNEETGNREYTSGLIGFIKPDGRLHTRISQMLKTGRLASAKPNLMNMPNRQEPAIQAAAGGDVPSLRSAFMAPYGRLIVAADYTQAEIATLAYLSGDEKLIDVVQTGRDIHSMVCKTMFRLDCTEAEVKALHKPLRVAAKSIIFGLLYGRGAAAVAREVEKAGVSCSIDEAQKFMSQFMAEFPSVAALIEQTHGEVEENGYVETLWGRREYFYQVEGDDGNILARQKRMAFNFLIQGYVADLLRKALINLSEYKRESGLDYKLILTVHDSIMLEAAESCAEEVAMHVLPECMTTRAPAPKLGFTIGSDVDVYRRWDEKMYFSELVDCGFSAEGAEQVCKKNDDGSIAELSV